MLPRPARGELGPFRCADEVDAYREDVERRARARRAAAAALARPVPARRRVGDARRHLREADRPRRRVLARRVPPGVRGRARPRRPRHRADRRRRVRDAPDGGDQGRRAATRSARAPAGGDRRAPAPPACSRCPPSRSATASSTATASSRRPRRCSREGQPRVRADRAPGGRGPGLLRGAERPTTSRSSRSTPARSCCSGTRARARPGGSRAALRADLAQLDADEFIAKWRRWQTA